MAKNKKSARQPSRAMQQAAAAANRAAKQQAHADRMAMHVRRNEAIAQYEAAEAAWHDGGCIGPCPLDPRFYDMSLFPENKPVSTGDAIYAALVATDDLLNAAEELGIDLRS
jgi:hypothetical protein